MTNHDCQCGQSFKNERELNRHYKVAAAISEKLS